MEADAISVPQFDSLACARDALLWRLEEWQSWRVACDNLGAWTTHIGGVTVRGRRRTERVNTISLTINQLSYFATSPIFRFIRFRLIFVSWATLSAFWSILCKFYKFFSATFGITAVFSHTLTLHLSDSLLSVVIDTNVSLNLSSVEKWCNPSYPLFAVIFG